MKKIKNLCLIGCGKTSLSHAQASNNLNTKIKYVFTKNFKGKRFKKFSKFFPKALRLQNLKNLDKLDVDGFIVALPWYLNDKFLLKYFINLRKPILFEKPIGFTNYKIWKKIKYPKNKYIAFNRRFYKNVNYAKKLIKQKDLLNVEATVSENLIAFKKKFPFLNSKFIVFNTAIHVIDLLCYFFGDLRVINKIGNLNNTNSNLIIILQNKNKLTIYVNISFNLPENNSITIKTKKKEIFKFKPIENLRIYNKLKIYERKGQRRYISTFEKEINENYKYKPGFLLQMQNFIFQKKFCKIDQIEKTMKVLKKIIN